MYYIERSFKIEISMLSGREKVTRFTRPTWNDQLGLQEHGGSQAKPLNICSTLKEKQHKNHTNTKHTNMNAGFMLKRYGLKNGMLYNCWLNSLTELPMLKIIKTVETTSLVEPLFQHLLMFSDQDQMPFLKATFNQTQDSRLSTETNKLSSTVLS